jgi:hypothetical protein
MVPESSGEDAKTNPPAQPGNRAPCPLFRRVIAGPIAFSSEVGTGSREENASNQKHTAVRKGVALLAYAKNDVAFACLS